MAKKQIEQTEIEAPYELPEGWKWCRLGDVADFLGGGTPDKSNSNYWNGNIPWASVKDIKGEYLLATEDFITELGLRESSANLSEKDGLILITRISPGKAIITKIQTAINQDLKIVNTKENKFFLKYFFDNNQSKIEQLSSGTTVKGIKLEILENIPFPLPPTLEEQQRIVNRIETLFAKLDEAKEKAQNVVDTFETRKVSILHKAFTGELTKKWREENGVGDDSWEEKTVGEAMYLQAGKNIPTNEISAARTDLHSFPCFGGNGIRGYVKSYNKDGSYPIIGRQGALCGNLNFASGKFYATEHAVVVTCPTDIDTMWAYYTLKTMNLNQYATATAQPGLAVSNINQLPITIPTINEQQEIVRILDTILEKESKAKESAEAVLEQIDLLKKSILTRAFRGEL